MEKELKGGFTRRAVMYEMNGKRVVFKKYQSSLRRLFIDFSRTCLSFLVLCPNMEFLKVPERIKNELKGRKRLDVIGLPTSKIKDWSFDKGYVVEEFINGKNVYQLFKKSKDVEELSFRIGLYTGLVHSKGYSFVDNRPQNYILSGNSIYRIDLELFKDNGNNFDRFCDVVSFVKSFPNNGVGQAFLRGYKKHSDYKRNPILEAFCKKYIDFLNSR